MKTSKRIIAAVLMVMMLASVMVLPALATTYETIRKACASFPTIRYENYYAEHHVALQRFLQAFGGNCEAYLMNADKNGNGGVDGYFGYWSSEALKAYQSARSLESDGHAGPATREQISRDMAYEEGNHYGLIELYTNGEWMGRLVHNYGEPLEALYVLRDETDRLFYSWS